MFSISAHKSKNWNYKNYFGCYAAHAVFQSNAVFYRKNNLIKISPFISLSVCFCCSWKDLTQPRLRQVLVTSCRDLFNLWINQWNYVYLILVDSTNPVTLASLLHRNIYKRSSDWSIDNRSLGHQNVSRTGLR